MRRAIEHVLPSDWEGPPVEESVTESAMPPDAVLGVAVGI